MATQCGDCNGAGCPDCLFGELPFELLLCNRCGHAFVRSTAKDTSWDCPRCGEVDDVDNLIEAPGPERDVTDDEFDRLCGFRSKQVAT